MKISAPKITHYAVLCQSIIVSDMQVYECKCNSSIFYCDCIASIVYIYTRLINS